MRLRDLDLGHNHSFIGPLLGLYLTPWPNFGDYGNGRATGTGERFRFPDRFDVGSQRHLWPISIEYMEHILRREYWDVRVNTFRGQALKPPRRLAVAHPKGTPTFHIYGPDFGSWVQGVFGMTFDERTPREPHDLLVFINNHAQAAKARRLQHAMLAQSQPEKVEENLRTYEADILLQYIEDLNRSPDGYWVLHDQIRLLAQSRFVAVRCLCCLLLSTMKQAGTDQYRMTLRDRGSADFTFLATQQNAQYREPRLWRRTLNLLRKMAEDEIAQRRNAGGIKRQRNDETGDDQGGDRNKRARP